ncbi:hypothetical protein R1T08_00575 [Streptomyces sp. SBC-4]|nr:hypothetical protein [Streptomyces sp. SBC-4]MDV5142859.1 hypothetical protein [Streptomyces sp. SBC-4]
MSEAPSGEQFGTGQEIAPPDPDAFTERVKKTGAAIHPVKGRLWYAEQPHGFESNAPVVSRDPKPGYATEERTSFEKIPDLLKKDGATAATILATNDVNGPADRGHQQHGAMWCPA